MARRRVVLPPPEAPRSATPSPCCNSNETPLRISFSPRRLWTPATTRFLSLMEAHSESQRDGEPGAHQDDVDDGKGGDGVHRTRRPERDDERPDDLGARTEQVDRRRVLADEDHEDQQEASQQPEANQRQRDVARNLPLRGPGDEGGLLELGTDLQERT